MFEYPRTIAEANDYWAGPRTQETSETSPSYLPELPNASYDCVTAIAWPLLLSLLTPSLYSRALSYLP